jgi:hypothetical protein
VIQGFVVPTDNTMSPRLIRWFSAEVVGSYSAMLGPDGRTPQDAARAVPSAE